MDVTRYPGHYREARTMELHDSTPHPLMAALGHGLPITLLVDLIDPNGPRSFEMFERETTHADDETRVHARVSSRIA